MGTVSLVDEADATDDIRAIFEDIRAAFGQPFVPAMFRAMAHHPT